MATHSGRYVRWLSSLAILIGSGCGKPALLFNDSVEGTVFLDGTPLANVYVEFIPDVERGVKAPSSSAVTDEKGHYSLNRAGGKRGAMVGQHLIVLLRGRGAAREIGERAEGTDNTKQIKDRRPIPAPYTAASRTPLRLEVLADQHTYNLNLVSKP